MYLLIWAKKGEIDYFTCSIITSPSLTASCTKMYPLLGKRRAYSFVLPRHLWRCGVCVCVRVCAQSPLHRNLVSRKLTHARTHTNTHTPTSPMQHAHKLLIKTNTVSCSQAPKRSTYWRDIAAPWQQKFIEFKCGRESLPLFSNGYCILLKT